MQQLNTHLIIPVGPARESFLDPCALDYYQDCLCIISHQYLA